MSDNYCFICGHYLADAWVLNHKNKRFLAGDHVSGNSYTRNSVENNGEPVIHEFDKKNEILFHEECYTILDKKCKYKLKWKDIAEYIEEPNAHGLVPYNDIQRPPDVNDIKKEHKWNEGQIIEEWEPVVDEIKTKNVELKKEKKQTLQMKRELKREQLRKQRDKKSEKIESLKLKLNKLNTSLESEVQQLENKETLIQTVNSDSKRTKLQNAIIKCNEKIAKKEESIEKEKTKLEELQQDYDLYLKAWF
jgi:DNA repair exonuclease SbcCD ATPase subunit